ncbi:uncharacterized protein PV09_06375 [Verruconis gallopava]|uniref:Uncharacterized protein n=1 Tax=Verruconis gallopava TaxID=253628 RepID=A0A0D1XIR0_9PEZI|nr:uncharacterized protein PV09_06375 [Verruconis gallopava]KIW02221.1 hypothetical protein PV09_06375 [Verruconis gallopava]
MSASVAPSLYLLPVLPRNLHKYLPILRWKYPLVQAPKQLPHEFFFYAARRSEAPLSVPARRFRRLAAINRALLLLQVFVWGPLYLDNWDVGTGSAKIPGTTVKLPLPEIKGWKGEERETVWAVTKERARRRLETERVDALGNVHRVYYDPSPGSIVDVTFDEQYEYLGEVW